MERVGKRNASVALAGLHLVLDCKGLPLCPRRCDPYSAAAAVEGGSASQSRGRTCCPRTPTSRAASSVAQSTSKRPIASLAPLTRLVARALRGGRPGSHRSSERDLPPFYFPLGPTIACGSGHRCGHYRQPWWVAWHPYERLLHRLDTGRQGKDYPRLSGDLGCTGRAALKRLIGQLS